jgi:peptidyl-prolyl cis-trans isomerase C
MFKRNTPLRSLLCLSLILLVAGLFGCSRTSQGEAGQEGQPSATGSAGSATSAPAAPGQAAATPGAAQPGAASSPFPASPADTKPLKPEELPAVVARCNGQEIKKEDLLEQAQKLRAQFASMGATQAPDNSRFYHEVLNTIVAQTLLQQEAKKEGITVTDAEVDQQIAALRSRFPDAEKFKQALASQGLSEEKLRAEMHREGAVQKLVEAKVLSTVNVTDAEAKDFYDKNQDKMKQPPRVHLRHILVRVDPKATDADKQKARAKAEDLLKRAKGGEDFAKLASENSDDPGSKTQGGDLSWLAPGQTVPPFEKAAFALTKPNEISPVVETQFGYHVIQLIERKGPSTVPFEQAKERIINFLKQRQAQEKLQAHVEELKSKGKVETFM